ncbi:MAG: ATP-dependent helicase, partial [Nanoarchaeota archaeon]
RMQNISRIYPVRIGLSATIAPLEEIAKFLIGSSDSCLIADVQFGKKIDVKILTPTEDMIDTTALDLHSSLYTLIDKLIQEHKTTLIFTNTRSATERVINHLKDMFPSRYLEEIGAHHSSLSKEHRFDIEERLRKGELKVVVTSTSLELGIDIGYIDLVILLGSPKSTARAMQRIGRAGHKLHDTAEGKFVVLDRDDLVECSVMLKEMMERKIDKVQIPKNCLDVLSQQIYGMAIYKVWQIKEMFQLIKGSYCYASLSYEDFLSVISYLAGEYALEDRQVYAKIWYDAETGQIGKRGKLARVIYMTNIGTIPEESFMSVIVAKGEKREQKVGMIDEAFLERIKPGDVFVLGGAKYQFLYARGMKAYVNSSVYRPPTIPSWFSEMLPLSFDLALEISRFRGLVEEKLKMKKSPSEIKGFIKEFCYVDEKTSKNIFNYMEQQYKYIGLPSNKKIIVENYGGEKNFFVFHALFGRRVNDALSRGIAFLLGRIGRRDIEIGISDNGFFLVGEKVNKEKIEKALKFLTSKNIEEVLKEAVERTEILNRRFRHCATRSLMILRNYKGIVKSVGKQQLKSHFLIAAVKKISSEFPILREARREIMEDLMDIENAKLVLDWVKEGKLKVEHKETNLPSPFSLNLILQGYSDLIKMEDRLEFLKRMHKAIEEKIGK